MAGTFAEAGITLLKSWFCLASVKARRSGWIVASYLLSASKIFHNQRKVRLTFILADAMLAM